MPPFDVAAGTARVSAVSRFSHPLNESWLIRVLSHLPRMSHSSSHSVPLSLCNINLPAALRSAWCTVTVQRQSGGFLAPFLPFSRTCTTLLEECSPGCFHLALLCHPGFPFWIPLNFAGESYHPASEVFHFRCFVTLLGQLGSPGGRPLTLHAGCVSPLLGLPLGVPLLWGPLLGSPF